MNCEQARQIFPELLDPRASVTEQLEARAHLVHCPDCQRDFAALRQTAAVLDLAPSPEPSPALRRNFYAMLEEEKQSAAHAQPRDTVRRRMAWWPWLLSPLAAAALLTIGFFAGVRSAPPAATVTVSDPTTQRQLRELQAKVDSMGQLVGYSLLRQQQQPATDRLRGVLTSAAVSSPSEQAINQLIGTLALDPNTNVRLRALEGLYPHSDEEVVRAGVLASLPREQNPLVQLAMIDFLTAARDQEAKPAFERISLSEAADHTVREAARRALTQL
jgi:hypothetical protein